MAATVAPGVVECDPFSIEGKLSEQCPRPLAAGGFCGALGKWRKGPLTGVGKELYRL
jgi:hypothetical protein